VRLFHPVSPILKEQSRKNMRIEFIDRAVASPLHTDRDKELGRP
jgi:hypothetical protein